MLKNFTWFCGLLFFSFLRIATADITQSSNNFLDNISLEELIHIKVVKVTSVSKKEEDLNDAAAAIYVIDNDYIRRSGATSIAEVLRLAPGLNVASANSSQWAISARGFNSVFAKMLVHIDGRAVFNPLFGGVLWNLQQVMLEDIDRVEVIRGPGATLWGANAVNGVINIVTRDSKYTQGGYIYGGGGNVHEALFGARYGGKITEKTFYRVFSSRLSRSDFDSSTGQSARDDWEGWQYGFRLDHHPSDDSQLTWQSDATIQDLDAGASEYSNFNTIGRWTHELSDSSNINAQLYYDRVKFDSFQRPRSIINTIDMTVEHDFYLSERNHLIWGAGYRHISGDFKQNHFTINVRDDSTSQDLFSAFFQNEFQAIPNKLTISAGIKIEHNDITGLEVLPGIRAMYKPTHSQTLWSAISRPVRTPHQIEGNDIFGILLGGPIPGPGGIFFPTLVGNGDPDPESLWAYELGYRIQPSNWISFDIATFYNEYSDLIDFGNIQRFVPGATVGVAEIPALNLLDSRNYGGEISITTNPTDSLRFILNYSLLIARVDGDINPINPSNIEDSAPQNQISFISSYDIGDKISVDGQLRYVDNINRVPAYLTADLRISYHPTEKLELSIVGQNLFDKEHPEQAASPVTTISEVPLGIYSKLAYWF